jgi:hypothetical protein
VIQAESQAALKTFTEHDFQHGLKNWQKRWEWFIRPDGDCFKGDGGQ